TYHNSHKLISAPQYHSPSLHDALPIYENWHVYRVDLKSGETKDLTPIKRVNAQIEKVSPHFPDELLIALNDRSASYHDVHRVNRSEEHTSELQSRGHLVCRLLLEK